MPRRLIPEKPLTPEEEREQALAYARFNDRAFLLYLLQDPLQMERFLGNPHMNGVFAEERNRCIYQCMEEVFLRHGTIDMGALIDELDARDVLDFVGGTEYLRAIEAS